MATVITDNRAALTAGAARALFRDGLVTPTAGWARGYSQANLVAVPAVAAYDVLLFCQRNPKPCPLVDVTDAGATSTPLAAGADLRTDLPLYHVWRDGELVEESPSAEHVWRDDLVTFLVGCSFTFEAALVDAGVPLRHLAAGTNVAMYRTGRQCRPAGRMRGPLVVSMRPVPAEQVATAVQVTSMTVAAHGAPVHVGAPAALGIQDLSLPDFGDASAVLPDEVPVFWACGVTLLQAIVVAKAPFAITHAPGHMLLTDVPDANLRRPG